MFSVCFRLIYLGSLYPEINSAVNNYVNIRHRGLGDFYRLPNWDDMEKLIKKVNEDHNLGILIEDIPSHGNRKIRFSTLMADA